MSIDGGSVEIRFQGDVTPLRQSVEEAVESLESVKVAAEDAESSLQSSLGSNWSKGAKGQFIDFADSACEAINKVVDASLSAGSSLKSIGSALKEIGSVAVTAGLTAATTGLIKMAKAGINDTSALENVKIQMIGLTDSVEKGNEAMRMAIKYYKNHPFNRFEVTDATKSLVQFGAKLSEVPGLLDKIGKVSLSTGAKIDTLAYYYQRMVSDGRVSMMDLQQMQTNNVPIMGKLAERLGTTAGGLRDLAREGKISVEDFKAAFEDLASDEAMEQFEKTLSRQIDRIGGRLSDLKGALAGYVTSETGDPLKIDENGIYRSYTKLIKKISDTLTNSGDSANPIGVNIIEGFQKLSKVIGGLIDKVTAIVEPALSIFGKLLNFVGDNAAILIPIFGGLLMKISSLGSSLPFIGGVFGKLNNSFDKLGGAVGDLLRYHPLLSAFIAIFGVGFMNALKNSEQFRNTMKSIGTSLGQIFQNLSEALRGIIDALSRVFSALADSGVIQGILQGIASALAWLAKALASISPETLAGLISFFVSLKLLKANPIMFVVSAIAMLITYVKELGGIGKFFADLPQKLKTIGHNLITGLVNGIKDGAKKVVDYVKSLASAITNTFKNMLGIHSPSKVMYDMGKYVVLGLAEGIQDNENVVEIAMNNLASDILKLSEKVIGDKVDFGVIDLKGQYQEWKKVSQMFAVGSEQYNQAIEKMEGARKSANLKILELQRSYNDALDKTISKIASMYGLFDDVNLKAGKNSAQILKGLDQQVAKTQEWAEAQKMIRGKGLDAGLVKELQNMGVEATSELSAIANMTADELTHLNDMWLKKQEIANAEGVAQMEDLKNDTLAEINDLKKGIDGITVDVADVGGRLVESISEGVYGAIPTLDEAFSKLGDYIRKASKGLGDGGNAGGNVGGDDIFDTSNVLEEITGNLGNLKDMLPKMLLGALGAVGVVKFGPKIFKALKNKIFGSKGDIYSDLLTGVFGSMKSGTFSKDTLAAASDVLFQNSKEGKMKDFWATLTGKLGSDDFFGDSSDTVKKTASNLKKTVNPAEEISESVSGISNSMQTTSKSISKVDSFLNSVIKGAGAIIAIAGAIAAMAGALWLTHIALKDVDWEKLAINLGLMAGAVAVFGTLAALADKFVGYKGILVIAGIAADIAVVALACRVAYEVMKPVDFVGFATAIGEMALAVGAFGALASLAGLLKSLIGIGIILIAGIAADIALVSLACRVAYEAMKVITWEDFGNMIGQMAAAIGVFGLFAGIFGIPIVAAAEVFGLLIIAGIALDIVAVSHACREAYETMKEMNWDTWGQMLNAMIETLGIMGGFQALFGLLAPLEFLGWGSIMSICHSITQVAEAIVIINAKVPDDIGGVKKKVNLLTEVLSHISSANLGNFFQNIGQAINATSVMALVGAYTQMAEGLARIQEITLKSEAILANVELIKEIVGKLGVSEQTSFGTQILNTVNTFLEAAKTVAVGSIVDTYKSMAENLSYIQDVELNYETIVEKVGKLKDIVDMLAKTDGESFWGQLEAVVNTFLESAKTNAVGSMIATYVEMADNLNKIQEVNLNKEQIKAVVEDFAWVVETVSAPARENGFWQQLGDMIKTAMQVGVTENAKKILEIYGTMGEAIDNIKSIPVDEEGVENKINALNRVVQSIVDMKGDGGVFGAIGNFFTGNPITPEKVEQVLEILRKFGDMANTVNFIPDINVDGFKNKMSAQQTVINEVGAVKDPGNIAVKDAILGVVKTMLEKFNSIAIAVNGLPNIRKEKALTIVQSLQDIVWQVGQVNSTGSDTLTTKEWVLGMAISMAHKLGEFVVALNSIGAVANANIVQETIGVMNSMFDSITTQLSSNVIAFENVGMNLGMRFAEGLRSQSPAVQDAGYYLQASFWGAIEAKMEDEYNQGVFMANKLGEGLRSVSFDNIGAQMQGSLWNGIQAKMDDEYWQGKALGERFRQGLYDVDYANAGWWAVQGFTNGANNRDPYSAGWQIANRFLQGLKDRGQQGSPWKTTIESGQWAVEGLIEGIKDQESALVGEATSLADQVIDALSMEDITMSPDLDANIEGRLAPSMADTEYGIVGGNSQGVVINQTNTNYTEYDVEQVQRDLAWELSKV